MNEHDQIRNLGIQAKVAARAVARLESETRKNIILAMAEGIEAATPEIIAQNEKDMKAGEQAGLSPAMLDRLFLDHNRIAEMATGLRQVASLPNPVGEVLEENRRPNGLIIRKIRVPLGVIAVIYESRPNVTADAAAICFKAGNAVILRGGSEALASNTAILTAMHNSGIAAGLPEHAIQLVPSPDREIVHALLKMDDCIDLVIPRGGEGLIRAVSEHATMPILKHYKGVCHVFVDAAADLDMALNIIENAKCSRPGVCNAVETLLIHEIVADQFLPHLAERLKIHKVELRGDVQTRSVLPEITATTEDDWYEEYLDLILAVRVVPDLDAAIAHIERYGSQHSDVIVTEDQSAATRFTREVDSATVYVNASSRFTDGGEFGLGAEIGISTGKLHARGPCGIKELTTYKYIIEGSGQIR